jgi:competence protein ComEA
MNRPALVLASALLLLGSLPVAAQRPQDARPAQGSQRATKPAPAATEVVNLNTATATQLASLPGIGSKTAALIVQYRQKNGSFKKIEEIMNVRGVGEKSFLKIKSRLTVAPPKSDVN